MFVIKPNLVVLLMFLYESYCERRIQEGIQMAVGKPYVVYLVKAPIAAKKYDYWTCGGAIVSSEFVITSAACVSDVNYLYVIAGYQTYVMDNMIELDQCTKNMKKKVIYTCYPDGYDINYSRLDKWSLIDIALVKVESPYNFEDEDYKKYCSYLPSWIPINYESKYQEPGTDAMVMGWGHKFKWRLESDKNNYNQRHLNFAPILIMDKETCKTHYEVYSNMSAVIDKYMICSLESGNIDENGEPIGSDSIKEFGCESMSTTYPNESVDYHKINPLDFVIFRCEDQNDDAQGDYRRRVMRANNISKILIGKMNKTVTFNNLDEFKKSIVSNRTTAFNKTFMDGRRHGICQNDHGAPLVTWVGTHEILIGVASVFKVSVESDCIGPYLYTSTQCNGYFLDCVLKHKDWPDTKREKDKSRRALCKKAPEDEGHPTVERHISWLYHPAGPADNEKFQHGRSKPQKSVTTEKQNQLREKHKEEGYAANDKIYAQNGNYPPNERHTTINVKYEPNGNHPLNEGYAANVPNGKYPSNGNYLPNGNYPPNSNYPLNSNYPANGNYPPNEEYAANDKYAPIATYPLNVGYAVNVPNGDHPPNGNYPPNEGYAAANDQYAPNVQYVTKYESYTPTQTNVWISRYKVSDKNSANVANNKNGPPDAFLPGDQHVANKRYPATADILRYVTVNDGLVMRPQVPLHI